MNIRNTIKGALLAAALVTATSAAATNQVEPSATFGNWSSYPSLNSVAHVANEANGDRFTVSVSSSGYVLISIYPNKAYLIEDDKVIGTKENVMLFNGQPVKVKFWKYESQSIGMAPRTAQGKAFVINEFKTKMNVRVSGVDKPGNFFTIPANGFQAATAHLTRSKGI